MAQDLEQLLKDVFGDSLSKLSQFQSDQVKKLNERLQQMAREALREDFARMQTELHELRERVTVLERERAAAAADAIQTSF